MSLSLKGAMVLGGLVLGVPACTDIDGTDSSQTKTPIIEASQPGVLTELQIRTNCRAAAERIIDQHVFDRRTLGLSSSGAGKATPIFERKCLKSAGLEPKEQEM